MPISPVPPMEHSGPVYEIKSNANISQHHSITNGVLYSKRENEDKGIVVTNEEGEEIQ
jgi:hypothetical protein